MLRVHGYESSRWHLQRREKNHESKYLINFYRISV